jgi:hypothetical protein
MPASGALAEWLGTGLQNPVHRFDSGRRLLFFRTTWPLRADFDVGFSTGFLGLFDERRYCDNVLAAADPPARTS